MKFEKVAFKTFAINNPYITKAILFPINIVVIK